MLCMNHLYRFESSARARRKGSIVQIGIRRLLHHPPFLTGYNAFAFRFVFIRGSEGSVIIAVKWSFVLNNPAGSTGTDLIQASW